MTAKAGKQNDDGMLNEPSSSEGVTRIYIGGLGGCVKDSDVLNLFAPLGCVSGIHFVRSKGRSFGYLDFTPSSDKSLAKLFSTYNGCMWKGGRLRLEKAKEHYLERLKREWAEDSEPSEQPASDHTTKDPRPSIRSKHEDINKAHIHIFFPKLRKVKALPFKGTGKHKYSFQRVVTSSSLPLHFCDCEEHSRLSEDLGGQRQYGPNSVVNDEERNIINSVMSKLLDQDEAGKRAVLSATDIIEEIADGACQEDPAASEQGKDDEEDAGDNLVTNILRPNSVDEEISRLMQLKPRESKSVDRRRAVISKQKKSKACEDRLSSPEKKMKRSLREAEESKTPQQEREMKTRSDPSEGCATSWIQKSSWRELVGDADDTSRVSIFTIAQVLAGTDAPAARPQISAEEAQRAPRDRGEAMEARRAPSCGGEVKAEEKKSAEKAAVPFSSAQVRSFVRSRDSDKDWAKAKAALSGYLKKRSRNNNPQAVEEAA